MQDMGPSFSHVGIFVVDLDRAVDFYKNVLDFIETDRGTLGDRRIVFLSRNPKEHHQVAFVSGLSAPPKEAIVNQISFRLPTLEAMQAYAKRARDAGATEFNPISHGNAWSVYFRDPEGNRVELFVDSPWYVSQPCREPIDIDRPASEIYAESEAWCRAQSSFRPASEFQAKVEAQIKAQIAAQSKA